jgi:hypothetical protein
MIDVDRHAFSTPLPTVNGDSSIWEALLDAQDLIMKCTRYTMSLKKVLTVENDTSSLDSSFLHLNSEVENLVARSVVPFSGMLFEPQIDSAEAVLITSLQLQTQIKLHSARIKLHRYRAFNDTPLFTKKHCDLQAAPWNGELACPQMASQSKNALSTPESSFFSSPASHISDDSHQPSTHDQSVNICLQSALAISKAFEDLPFPCPIQSDQFDLRNLNMLSRTMPAFACCAMQGSYVLLMACLKGWRMDDEADSSDDLNPRVLQKGLERILSALDNYSVAFEALQGMTSEFELKCLKLLQDTDDYDRPSSGMFQCNQCLGPGYAVYRKSRITSHAISSFMRRYYSSETLTAPFVFTVKELQMMLERFSSFVGLFSTHNISGLE